MLKGTSEDNEKSISSKKDRDDLLTGEKENMQNKSEKKVSTVLDNSCSNFLCPDQDKLMQIFVDKSHQKEEKETEGDGKKLSF